jgi:cytochrome c5
LVLARGVGFSEGMEIMKTMKALGGDRGPRAVACAQGWCGILLGLAVLLFLGTYGYPERSDGPVVGVAHGDAAGAAIAAPLDPPGVPLPQAESAASGRGDLILGEKVFEGKCIACHGVGRDGAPKIEDAESWHRRASQGIEALVQHAVRGHRHMPAKGGFSELSDEEVAAAVAYVVDQSRRIIAGDRVPTAEQCEVHGRLDGCTPEQERKLLVLQMLRLLAGRH